jgi:hypothetical protein
MKEEVSNHQKQQKTKDKKIEHLKKLTKVSFATLAANNHYVLNESVRDLVYAKHQAEQAAQAVTDERRRAAEEKKTQSLKNALQKTYGSRNEGNGGNCNNCYKFSCKD